MDALRSTVAPLLGAALLAGCATAPPGDHHAGLRAAETAFAQSMADRDFTAFAGFIADDAVFVNGGQALRGKPAILAHWKRFFESAAAPFSWAPEVAEVVPSAGPLGYTEGPVKSPAGTTFARFHSTWQRGAGGRWLVVFDNGQRVCDCGAGAK